MKKTIICMAVLAALFTGCATGSGSGGGITLNEALAQAAAQIEGTLQTGTTIAPLNFVSSSPNFSVFVLDGLTSHLVRGGNLRVVSRSEAELASVRGELAFQHTGEVSDDTIQSLGQMLGAQSIISGQLFPVGGNHRLVIRVVNVQNASVEVMYAATITNNAMVAALLDGPGSQPAPAVARAQTAPQTAPQAAPQAAPAQVPARASEVNVPGDTFADWQRWLLENARRNTVYRVEITEDINAPPFNLFFSGQNNITIIISGAGGVNRTVAHSGGTGALITVSQGVGLVLDNVTLQGRTGNNAPVVRVAEGGSLVMGGGSRITGNVSSGNGGGVVVERNGRFTMAGGEISGNASRDGGGVRVQQNGSFTMTGGEIFGNTVTMGGGGVSVITNGNFTMRGGEIFGNSAQSGGGVDIHRGAFTMAGGEISGNTARRFGGGVSVGDINARFDMTGGEISGNIAADGGGVFRNGRAVFTKTGGVIHGAGSDTANRATGNVNSHAVGSANRNIIRISTAGPDVRLNTAHNGAAGGWQN